MLASIPSSQVASFREILGEGPCERRFAFSPFPVQRSRALGRREQMLAVKRRRHHPIVDIVAVEQSVAEADGSERTSVNESVEVVDRGGEKFLEEVEFAMGVLSNICSVSRTSSSGSRS